AGSRTLVGPASTGAVPLRALYWFAQLCAALHPCFGKEEQQGKSSPCCNTCRRTCANDPRNRKRQSTRRQKMADMAVLVFCALRPVDGRYGLYHHRYYLSPDDLGFAAGAVFDDLCDRLCPQAG